MMYFRKYFFLILEHSKYNHSTMFSNNLKKIIWKYSGAALSRTEQEETEQQGLPR